MEQALLLEDLGDLLERAQAVQMGCEKLVHLLAFLLEVIQLVAQLLELLAGREGLVDTVRERLLEIADREVLVLVHRLFDVFSLPREDLDHLFLFNQLENVVFDEGLRQSLLGFGLGRAFLLDFELVDELLLRHQHRDLVAQLAQ